MVIYALLTKQYIRIITLVSIISWLQLNSPTQNEQQIASTVNYRAMKGIGVGIKLQAE